MISEITYLATDSAVDNVTVGIFPSSGRYFRKTLDSKDGVFFHTKVDLPAGKSFYQVFINEEFESPLADLPGLLSDSDPLKRVLINNETDIFCPVIFKEKENAIHIHGEACYLNLISLHQFIAELYYVNEDGLRVLFKLSHQYKNRKYWHLEINENLAETPFLIELKSDCTIGYLTRNGTICSKPDFDNAYKFDVVQNHKNTQAFNAGYQIFPDRYGIEGDTVSNCLEWGSKPGYFTFLGGNFKGIQNHLDHISDLEVDFVYLNPIFKAENSHRYDVEDYLEIDPLLGDEIGFKKIVDELHLKGIKVILDIPLNHCGVAFFAFKDLLKNQDKSAYKDWFEVFRFPVDISDNTAYSCWSGYKEYPQFNLENNEVLEYFKSVSRHWIEKYDIDGWRLDSCSEISHDFIRQFVDYSRSLKKDLFFVGEDWHNEFQILDDGVNGITNYGLYWDVILPYFEKNGSLRQLAYNIMELFYQQTPVKRSQCWNFLSNHDIARFYSIVEDEKEVFLALDLISSLPGIPIIYYGEEFNMKGSQDPENRGCMEWDKLNESENSIDAIKRIALIRKRYSEIFQFGSLEILHLDTENELLLVQRTHKSQSLYFIFNFSDHDQLVNRKLIANHDTLKEAIDGKSAGQYFNIDSQSSLILIAQ